MKLICGPNIHGYIKLLDLIRIIVEILLLGKTAVILIHREITCDSLYARFWYCAKYWATHAFKFLYEGLLRLEITVSTTEHKNVLSESLE